MKNNKMRQIVEWVIVVLVAVIVWFFVISEQNPTLEKTISIPLKYDNIGDGLTVVNKQDELRISVRIPRDRISDLRSSNFEAVVDLKGLHEGNHKIRPAISAPDKIEVIDDGGELSIRLEPAVEKQLPLELRKTVDNPYSYLIKEILKPDFIMIRGAKDNVLSVAKAVVELELDRVTASTTFEVTPKLYTATGDTVSDEVQIVPAKVTVAVKMYSEKSVRLSAKTYGRLPAGKFTINPSEIKIYGDQAHLAAIAEIETNPVNLSSLYAKGREDCQLVLPADIYLSPNQEKVEYLYIK